MKTHKDKIKVTVEHPDGLTHLGFDTALRTFCGNVLGEYKEVENLSVSDGSYRVRWAVGKASENQATCSVCRQVMRVFADKHLSQMPYFVEISCPATTRKGTRCQREPVENGLCPSHKHLALVAV